MRKHAAAGGSLRWKVPLIVATAYVGLCLGVELGTRWEQYQRSFDTKPDMEMDVDMDQEQDL